MNLKLEKFKMTAIVGPSGSGKTTLVNLLLGLMTQTDGVILIDDVNLNELDINQYRKTVSYVDQETFFFNRTTMENLKWIEEDANEAQILEAVKLANATEFIKDFEEGFDTKLGRCWKKFIWRTKTETCNCEGPY